MKKYHIIDLIGAAITISLFLGSILVICQAGACWPVRPSCGTAIVADGYNGTMPKVNNYLSAGWDIKEKPSENEDHNWILTKKCK